MADLDLGTLRYNITANTSGLDIASDSVLEFKRDADQAAISTKRYGEQLIRMGGQARVSAKQINTATAATEANTAAQKRSAASMRNMRGVAQQFGWQMQDVAVQLQAGTNAITVFTQQGSQMAAAFGPAVLLWVHCWLLQAQ